MQKFSYHTHTNFSDGKNSLEEMLDKAVSLGWEEIGISDHLIVHKNVQEVLSLTSLRKKDDVLSYYDSFDSCLSAFQRHSENIRRTALRYPSLKVKIGYEVDYYTYDGWEEDFREFISLVDHDYLVNGNHFFSSESGNHIVDIYLFKNGFVSELWSDSIEIYLRRHYETMVRAIDSGLFDFLAHLDYARKIPDHQKYPMVEEKLSVVNALARNNMACEISTKGLRKVGDFYPENNILQELIKQNVPLVISDDAHKTEELGYNFDKAEYCLQELGCRNRFHLK